MGLEINFWNFSAIKKISLWQRWIIYFSIIKIIKKQYHSLELSSDHFLLVFQFNSSAHPCSSLLKAETMIWTWHTGKNKFKSPMLWTNYDDRTRTTVSVLRLSVCLTFFYTLYYLTNINFWLEMYECYMFLFQLDLYKYKNKKKSIVRRN